MDKRELILVCGVSGAGKTITMNYFESAGFYCIDNLPIDTLVNVVKSLKSDEHYFNYAIAINSKTDENEIADVLTKLKTLEWLNVNILYLDADEEIILNRYQFTRKQHPFTNQNETLLNAVKHEKELLKGLRQYSNVIIDTSELKDKELINKLSRLFDRDIIPEFRLCFVSFGYKNGLPKDLDYVFDVRFIPNPYYIEELRCKTGNDKNVYSYVMSQNETKEFLEKLIPLLDYCVENHKRTGRSCLIIGIGCTGGQHRSISICNYLANYYSDKYEIIKDHRDEKRSH